MYLLSIDPATVSGFALFRDGVLVRSGTVRISSYHDIERFYKEMRLGDFLLATESFYVHRNPRTFLVLSKILFSFELLADKCQGYYHVSPFAWQRWAGIEPKMVRNERKKKSVACVYERLGINVSNDNEADAVNIGLYVLDNYERLPVLSREEILRWR